ncbi:hypothetical protein GCM10010388_26290 [Streptomyces mauvecolor]
MPVGRGHIDDPRLRVLPVLRQLDGQGHPAGQHLGDNGPVPRIEVLDDQHGYGKIGSERAQKYTETMDAPGRGRDSNDVVPLRRVLFCCHTSSLADPGALTLIVETGCQRR